MDGVGEGASGHCSSRSSGSVQLQQQQQQDVLPTDLHPGIRVRVRGLLSHPELNGREGTAEKWAHQRQRWEVRLDCMNSHDTPLGLKPENPTELYEMQTKEINNGRLAMIAIAGMVAQELATGKKLFG